MTLELIFALVVFAFVSSITPGPNNMMLLASGTNYGFVRTLTHMLGVSVGFTIMIVLLGTGLMQLFDKYPLSYTILKVLSVIYLLYLAWRIATASRIENGNSEEIVQGKPFTFLQAALFQWINPKAWALALTVVSAYTPPSQSFTQIIVVALICGVVNAPSVGCWVILGTQLRRLLSDQKRLRIFNIGMAVLLVLSLYPILIPM